MMKRLKGRPRRRGSPWTSTSTDLYDGIGKIAMSSTVPPARDRREAAAEYIKEHKTECKRTRRRYVRAEAIAEAERRFGPFGASLAIWLARSSKKRS